MSKHNILFTPLNAHTISQILEESEQPQLPKVVNPFSSEGIVELWQSMLPKKISNKKEKIAILDQMIKTKTFNMKLLGSYIKELMILANQNIGDLEFQNKVAECVHAAHDRGYKIEEHCFD